MASAKNLRFLATVLSCYVSRALSCEGVKALLLLRFCQVILICAFEKLAITERSV